MSSIFIEDGEIVSVRGRNRPNRTEDAVGDAIPADVPVVVLVDRGSASASEIVTGALRDRGRATVVGTRTYGKGLVQEVIDLSNGGVLDLTVANYYLPNGETITRKGLQPQVKAKDDPRHEARRGAAGGARHRSAASPVSAAGTRRAARRLDAPAGGRAREARPLPGGASRSSATGRAPRWSAASAGPGDLVLVGSGKRGARVVRVLGRPDRARDVVEGLMLDRGLHRNYGRAATAEAVAADRRTRTPPTRAWTSPDLPTFTIDPDDAKDFDDAISATPRERARAPLGPHRRRDRVPASRRAARARRPLRRATSVYVPGRRGADAARGALEPRLLAAARARRSWP